MRVFALIVIALLAGCASTPGKISTAGPESALSGLPSIVAGKTVADDLAAAGQNLDQAVAIGILPATDPAVLCLGSVNKQVNGTADAQSFAPENAGAISAGSIAYIIAQQARAAGGIKLPVECEALVGRLVIDGMRDARKLMGLRLFR